MRGRALFAAALAMSLTACATNRIALTPTAAPGARGSPAPSRPVAAHALASRMGMAYRDAGDHVLLTDRDTRVRIWKDSNRVSVAGREQMLGARTQRRGLALVVPASTASYLERAVADQRRHYASLRRRVAAPPPVRRSPTAYEPLLPPAEPDPAPRPPAAAPAEDAPSAWTPSAPERDWRWIVLHHSSDTSGNLAKYDRIHREERRWDECGYHFVIGNGSLSGDGAVEVSSRWPVQKHGAHAKRSDGDNCYNEEGIGICLVGNFESCGAPSRAQVDALVRLCGWLMARYDIPLDRVLGHSDCKATACPGRNFPWVELRRRLSAPRF